MKINKSQFVRFSDKLTRTFHHWEFWMPFEGGDGKGNKTMLMRQVKFEPEEYETPEDQFEALCDMVRGARFADMDYYIFCDDRLVLNF